MCNFGSLDLGDQTIPVLTRAAWELVPRLEPSRLSRSSAVSIMVVSCSSRIRLGLQNEVFGVEFGAVVVVLLPTVLPEIVAYNRNKIRNRKYILIY